VRFFDLDKVNSFTHTPEIVQLAATPEDFDLESAYTAVLDYIDSFTQVIAVKQRPRGLPYESQETIKAKQEARFIECRLKEERVETRRRRLHEEWIRAAEAWRMLHEKDAKVTVAEARLKFFTAVRDKNLF
jgi:hypothetical protein